MAVSPSTLQGENASLSGRAGEFAPHTHANAGTCTADGANGSCGPSSGASGSGYLGNWGEFADQLAAWGNVSFSRTGTYRFTIRFQNGNTTTASRNVLVDGGVAGSTSLFSTGSWSSSSWGTVTVNVVVQQGTHTIGLSVPSNDNFVNLDNVSISWVSA